MVHCNFKHIQNFRGSSTAIHKPLTLRLVEFTFFIQVNNNIVNRISVAPKYATSLTSPCTGENFEVHPVIAF
jgi:hypothetical protein